MTSEAHSAGLEAENAALREQLTALTGALDQVDTLGCEMELAPRTGRLSREV